jgi:hypothetical protein
MSISGPCRRLAAVALASLAACGGPVGPGPATTLQFEKEPDVTGDALGAFGVNLRITATIEHQALRKPPLSKSVDVQVAAMLAYVRQHGRGVLHEPSLPKPRKATQQTPAEQKPAAQYERLYTVAVHAMAHLNLQRGSAELSRAALTALLHELGPDASLTPGREQGRESNPEVASDLLFAQRDGIAYLALRRIDDEVGTRVGAVLSQWAASDAPPRAVIVDLSRCEDAEPSAAATLVHILAPGRLAFVIETRDAKTSALMRHAFRGSAEWSQAAYAATPVFVVVSERSASLAEAVAHALRHHRTAHVLGTPSAGDGRMMDWYELADGARFSFTVGDVLGVDEKPLRDQAVVPDACRSSSGTFVALAPRSVERARATCDGSLPTQDEAIDYVRALLAVEAAAPDARAPAGTPTKSAAPPLQHGESES